MENTLYELGLQAGGSQKALVDMITKDAPVLATVPMFPTTHGFHNLYEKIVDVDALAQVDMDATLSEVGMRTSLAQTDLAKFGGKMTVGKDALLALYPGMSLEEAATQYFGSKLSKITRATAEAMDYALIYNFIRSIGNTASKFATASGSNNHNYHVSCVRWEEGENCGLYNPNKKTMKNVTQLIEFYLNNGGTLANIVKNGATIPGFEAILETYFTFQMNNTNHVAGIKNIDLDISGGSPKNPPTAAMFDKMIRDARARSTNSYIYLHAAVKDYMSQTYATSVSKAEVGFGNYKMNLMLWKDIPMVTSENFVDGTEANL